MSDDDIEEALIILAEDQHAMIGAGWRIAGPARIIQDGTLSVIAVRRIKSEDD